MKNLLLALVICMIVTGVGFAQQHSRTYVVAVPSYTILGAEGNNWNTDVTVSSSTLLRRIIRMSISTDNQIVPQTVTLYDNASSTSEYTKLWEVHIPSATDHVYFYDFEMRYPLEADNGLLIRKTSNNSSVNVSLQTF